ncbi:MAG: hypothetical protein AAFY98_06755 [Verrucomicrobiota bacterium]
MSIDLSHVASNPISFYRITYCFRNNESNLAGVIGIDEVIQNEAFTVETLSFLTDFLERVSSSEDLLSFKPKIACGVRSVVLFLLAQGVYVLSPGGGPG